MKWARLACRTLAAAVMASVIAVPVAYALGSSQNPQSGTVGFEATVPGNPPTQAATIGVPANGQIFTDTPITVSGLCKDGLLIKVFSNNVFVGSADCTNSSYSIKVDLFSGRNDLIARVYDALDQQGPDSNTVSVTFNDAKFAQFGTHVTLTSTYARKGANPGTPLDWPFVLSGGVGPYALSIDWGDSSGSELKSVSFPGVVTLSHTYTQAGVYPVVIKATDANGTAAYLQVVGVANGQVTGALNNAGGQPGANKTVVVLWQPMLIALPLLLLAFWLGARHELYAIRRSIEESRNQQY